MAVIPRRTEKQRLSKISVDKQGVLWEIVVSKMGILTQNFSKNMISNTTQYKSKIPEYAREYKREYQFIRGINKDLGYFINKINDRLNNGLNEFKLIDRIKFNLKRFLRGQEKGTLKDISDFALPNYDYCFIEEFYLYVDNYVFFDGIIDKEFFEMTEKIYNKIKIEKIFSDVYGEGFCI